MSTWQERRKRVERLANELRQLQAIDLVEILLPEFDRRRLDQDGNPCREPGLYEAATEAMVALVTGKADNVEMVKGLTAVGRGVHVRSADKDAAPLIREIAPLVDLVKDPAVLAATLATRFDRPIDAAAIAAALARGTRNGKIADVVIAAGIVSLQTTAEDGGLTRDQVLARVGKALART